MYFLIVTCSSTASWKQIPRIFFHVTESHHPYFAITDHKHCALMYDDVAHCHGYVFTLCPADLVVSSASQLHWLTSLFFSQSQHSITQHHSQIWLHNGQSNI
jgi:hypothetical protein